MEKQATVTCQIVRVEPAGGTPYIVADLRVLCDVCGRGRMVLHGHHVRAAITLLQEVVAACPDETAEGTVIETNDIPVAPGGKGVQ